MDTPRFSPTIALLTLSRGAEVEVARILEPQHLSPRKLLMLQRLASVPGATPADLSRTIGLTVDESAPLLRAMTVAGLVRRGRDGTLTASEAGTAALKRVDAALNALDATLFAERADLADALFRYASRHVDDQPG